MSKRELYYLMMYRWIVNCKESNGLIIKVIIIRIFENRDLWICFWSRIYDFIF